MTFKKENTAPKKSTGFIFILIVILLGIAGLALTVYIGYRASISDRKLFSVSLLALFAGLLFESFRVSGSWKPVISIFIGSYFFSFINFFPYKREHNYVFENHIESWPYVFIFFYAFAFAFFHKNRVTAKLNEGTTLLQSLSVVYWAVDYGFTNHYNWFTITLLTIALLFSAFSVLHALTYLHLSKTARLTLSVWSSVIMFAFALDNIIKVFNNPDIESSKYLSEGFYIGLQYFLLGVSAVYIMQNYMLLAAFFPTKNRNYKNDLREAKKDHLERYSDKQVFISHSLLCIVYAVTIYGLNYTYQIIPRHTMIWLVFLTFPFILKLTGILNGRINYG